jgi:WD40 repeat protein
MPTLDPAKTKLSKELKHNSPLVGCRFDPTGKFVFAAAQDNSIQRWEIASGKKTAFEGHKSWARGLAFTNDGKTLFSADWTGKILVWPADAEKAEPRQTIQAHTGWARALSVSPDGKTLASIGNDGKVCLWATADGKPIRSWQAHDCHGYNVAFHPDGKSLASADLKGIVKHWDLTSATMTRELDAKAVFAAWPSMRMGVCWPVPASRMSAMPSPVSAIRLSSCSTGRQDSASSS